MTQRVALVTGAMGGLGTAICQELAKAGHKVVAAYHPQFDNKDEWLKEQAAAGFKDFVCVAGDVSVLEDCQKMVADAEAACGQVDILINNAGIGGGQRAFEEIDDAQLDRMFQVHVMGSWYCTRAVLPGMKQRRRGKIINTSSILGLAGRKRSSHYAAAKAALIGLTKAWAREFAEWNIQVNAVAPGRVRTPILGAFADSEAYRRDLQANVPLGRRGEPEEVAWLVAFLACAEADFLTGQVISQNGGEVI